MYSTKLESIKAARRHMQNCQCVCTNVSVYVGDSATDMQQNELVMVN